MFAIYILYIRYILACRKHDSYIIGIVEETLFTNTKFRWKQLNKIQVSQLSKLLSWAGFKRLTKQYLADCGFKNCHFNLKNK